MFRKMMLKKKIRQCKRKITRIEQKRNRSQSSLVTSILTKTTPDDMDVDYFNKYTDQINKIRAEMAKYQSQL